MNIYTAENYDIINRFKLVSICLRRTMYLDTPELMDNVIIYVGIDYW